MATIHRAKCEVETESPQMGKTAVNIADQTRTPTRTKAIEIAFWNSIANRSTFSTGFALSSNKIDTYPSARATFGKNKIVEVKY